MGTNVLSTGLITGFIFSCLLTSHVWLKKYIIVEAKTHCIVQRSKRVHFYE
jgi:hypothetical protein